MVEPERWKPVKGYEDRYLISSYGSIYSLWHDKRMSLYMNNDNRATIKLYKNYDVQGYIVSNLVGQHFVPNPDNKPEINHKNGIKSDDYYKNLEWVTRSENIQHAHDLGLYDRRNENNPHAKFTNKQVRQIRQQYENTNITQQQLAEKYDTKRSTINGIVNYYNYQNI